MIVSYHSRPRSGSIHSAATMNGVQIGPDRGREACDRCNGEVCCGSLHQASQSRVLVVVLKRVWLLRGWFEAIRTRGYFFSNFVTRFSCSSSNVELRAVGQWQVTAALRRLSRPNRFPSCCARCHSSPPQVSLGRIDEKRTVPE